MTMSIVSRKVSRMDNLRDVFEAAIIKNQLYKL